MVDLTDTEFVDVDPDVLVPPGPTSVFVDLLGLVMSHVSPRRVEAHFDVDERLHQPYGLVHGGVHAAVIETLCSFGAAAVAAADGRGAVGLSNSTDFVRPHRAGRLDAVATPIHLGRTQHLWRAAITRADDGKLVAQGQVRLQVVDPVGLGG